MTSLFTRIRSRRKLTPTQWLRIAVQAVFLAITANAIIRHRINESIGLAGPTNQAPSVDSLSPFGGLETLWTWVRTGETLNHLHPSDLVLLAASLLLVVALGSAFCGWICPFGTIQEWLYRLRARLFPWKVTVPEKLDRLLRYGRYVVLGLVLFATYSLGEFIFGDYCPWKAVWQIGSTELAMGGGIVLGLVVVGGLLVERAWCRYACPLGAVLGLAGRLTPLKLKRAESACKACGLCSRQCPMDLGVAHVDEVKDTTCMRCLECVETCPKDEALGVKIGSRPVRGWVYGTLAVVIFSVVILLAIATGNWQATASAEPPKPAAESGQISADEIKGWRSLQEIIDIWGIPEAVLYREIGLTPADMPPSTQIKQLEGRPGPGGVTLDRTFVVDVVKRWQAGVIK